MIQKIYLNYNEFFSHFKTFSEDLYCDLISKYGVRIYSQENTPIKIVRIDFFCDEMVQKFILDHKQLYKRKMNFRSVYYEENIDKLLKEKVCK